MLAASAMLGVDQLFAMAKIHDEDRRDLAMTYYLRGGGSMSSRWSWTDEQIKAYERSAEYSVARAEIEKIDARFSMDNPGYALHANTKVRSLEEQLSRWETESSVGEAARELREHALANLAQGAYPDVPDHASIKKFYIFLNAWRASRWPTVMAPGLSLHGRGRAYDFQVQNETGHIVAAADASTVATVWDTQGWSDKLSHAVHAASSRFTGPLLEPYEPWHYEYQ